MAYGTLAVDTLNSSTGVLATQNGMTGIAKAWVTFNGSTGAISKSFNVSSVTLNTAGANWTINFTTAMPDANYAIASTQNSFSTGAVDGRQCALAVNLGSQTTSAFTLYSYNTVSGGAGSASGSTYVVVFD